VFALRTLHPDEVLLYVLAFRISAAGDELAVASVTQHHVASALRADFFERNVGNLLALIESARSLAVRIARAGHELPKASALEDHHTSAVLAVLFLRGLLHVGAFQIGKIDGVLFGERAAIGIFLVVGAAGEE